MHFFHLFYNVENVLSLEDNAWQLFLRVHTIISVFCNIAKNLGNKPISAVKKLYFFHCPQFTGNCSQPTRPPPCCWCGK